MSFQSINLDPSQLLLAVNESLNKRFYANHRDQAKLDYQLLNEGQLIPFMVIGTEDHGEIQCELSLDSSEYVGKLSFSKFRKALAMMMLGIKNRLDEKQSLNVMTSDNGEVLFNIPGVHESADGANVIVCGLSQNGPGKALVKLMYLDPKQYVQAAAAVSEQQ